MGFRCDRTVLREADGNTPNPVIIRGNVMHAENGAWVGGTKDWLIEDNTIISPGPEGEEPWPNGHALWFRGSDHFMIRNNILYAKNGLFLDDLEGSNVNTA
eukprot:scaffold16518_cov34-Attheya_sp.AAC.2